MKKLILLTVVSVLAYGLLQECGISIPGASFPAGAEDSILQRVYDSGESDLQVEGKGVVINVLSDDLDGSKHQRFILRLDSGQTLLIAHNIDLAPRINGLKIGDTVEFCGEYEWNSKGGVVHWTHRDPSGRHVEGWLKCGGRTYQ